jgi:hypothetical protein
MKDENPSRPTILDGVRRVIIPLTYEAETGLGKRMSEVAKQKVVFGKGVFKIN